MVQPWLADWTPTPAQRANSELAEIAIARGTGLAVQRPVRVYMQLASACNLGCYMCTEYDRPEGERYGFGLQSMSEEIVQRLEREVFPFSSHVQLGVGGEPTFSKDFVGTVERSAAANQHITLITNGTFLERERISRCIAENVHFTQLSIDAATPQTYERIRIQSKWSRLMKGIETFQAMREVAGRPTGLQLNFVLMRSNIDELVRFIEFAHSIGADAVFGQHVNAVTEPSQSEPLVKDKARYNRIRGEAVARAAELGIPLRLPAPFAEERPEMMAQQQSAHTDPAPTPVVPEPATPTAAPGEAPGAAPAALPIAIPDRLEPWIPVAPDRREPVPCREPYHSVVVLYNGLVHACCHPLAHSKMKLGNLLDQPFEDIWNGEHFKSLRGGMPCGDVPLICRECPMVHDPPPSQVDDEFIERSETIAEYYGERRWNEATPLAAAFDYLTDLRAHATALEAHANRMEARAELLEQKAAERDAAAEVSTTRCDPQGP